VERGEIIPHVRDTEAFDPDRFDGRAAQVEHGIPTNSTVVMFSETPRLHKGVEELLELVSACPEDVVGVIYKQIFSALGEYFDYVITVSDHGELLGERHGMWNHINGTYPELTHVPLAISSLKENCDLTVSTLDLYTTILELAGGDSDQDGSQILTSPRDSRTYLAEYRGPFDRSLERSKSEGLDFDKYDRDLFALIESGYHGYEDYDGWREVGDSSRANPQDDLNKLLDRVGMRRLQVNDDSNLDDSIEDRLEKLGYI